MSHTPEVIISKPLEFLHNAFGMIGVIFAIGTALTFAQSGNFVLPALISGAAFYIASKIKFRWVKRGEVGVYE